MLDARSVGIEIGKRMLAAKSRQALPVADVHLPEMVVNVAPAQPVETVIPAPVVNVTVEPSVHNVAAPHVEIAAPVVNVSIDMKGIEAALTGMADRVIQSEELNRLGLKMLADAGSKIAAALMAPKVLVNGPDGKPSRVEPVKVN